jgi:hypothetical protein
VNRYWQIQGAGVLNGKVKGATALCWTGESLGEPADNLARVRKSFVVSVSHAGLLGYLWCGFFTSNMAIDLFF